MDRPPMNDLLLNVIVDTRGDDDLTKLTGTFDIRISEHYRVNQRHKNKNTTFCVRVLLFLNKHIHIFLFTNILPDKIVYIQ